MSGRQFETSTPSSKAERVPARQPPGPELTHDHAVRREEAGGRLAGAVLLQLQRAYGNQYVQRVIRDATETLAAQRAEAGEPLAEPVGAAGGELDAGLQRDVEAARGGGRTLDAGFGARMGEAFGTDFGGVRVHTDARADALAQSLRASAFTVGGDIFLRSGAYAPGKPGGQRLLAHELTHVVQQRGSAGGRVAGRLTVGPAGDRHERDADHVAEEVTGHQAPPPSVATGAGTAPAPVAGVQRRYLDVQPKAGIANWVKDTTVKKGLVQVSRGKLAEVDHVLGMVLGAKAQPDWIQQGQALLNQLEAALDATKYGLVSKKKSDVFKARRRAVVTMKDEVQKAVSTIMLSKIIAAGAPPTTVANPPPTTVVNQQPTTVVNPPPITVVNQQPTTVVNPPPTTVVNQQPTTVVNPPPDPATELAKVGFLPAYLQSIPPTDLDLLFEAHQALAAKDFTKAQATFDILNPPKPATGMEALPGFWEQEQYTSIIKGSLFDFGRTKSDLMAAQRQLIVYHAPSLGGEYAKLMSYKPYKKQALTPTEVQGASKYFGAAHLRDWDTLIEPGFADLNKGQVSLDQAQDKAQGIADAATAASLARRTQANRPIKPAKEKVTPHEVTAIRIYTADEYKEMNAVFRDFRVDQPTVNWEKYSAIARLAISGLGKLPKARGTISYRGDNDIDFGGHGAMLKFGATFRLPNFYSTTTNQGGAFSGKLAYIFHNQRYGRLIEEFSAYPGEAEVLIPPGSAYRITGEFHIENGSWVAHDGSGLSTLAQAFQNADPHKAKRERIIEFIEL